MAHANQYNALTELKKISMEGQKDAITLTFRFDERMFSGELDECGLTLKDLATIRDSFLPLLAGIHHHRIAYPGQKERLAAVEQDVKDSA